MKKSSKRTTDEQPNETTNAQWQINVKVRRAERPNRRRIYHHVISVLSRGHFGEIGIFHRRRVENFYFWCRKPGDGWPVVERRKPEFFDGSRTESLQAVFSSIGHGQQRFVCRPMLLSLFYCIHIHIHITYLGSTR